MHTGLGIVLAFLSLSFSSAFQPPATWSSRETGPVRQPSTPQRRLVKPLLAKKAKKRRKKAKPVAPSVSEDMASVTPSSPEDFLALAEEIEDEFQFVEEEEEELGSAANTAVADGVEDDTGGLFDLPSVADLEQKRQRTAAAVAKTMETETQAVKKEPRIKRKDLKELRDLLELDPSADMLPETFAEDYDMTSMLLGEAGRDFLGIGQAYLQSGHLILVLTCILCAFVDYPGNPLTQFPNEIRDFLKTGLFVTYTINAVLAVLAVFRAAEKRLPVPFWTAKTFLLGGLAFDELNRSPAQALKKKRK